MKIKREQTVCEWKGVEPAKPKAGSKLGIAIETIGKVPINGLRHKEQNGTNGWYIWCGEGNVASGRIFLTTTHRAHFRVFA